MTETAARNHTENRLQGTLGPGAIVFMVVAAAAPLTVVAGSVPLGMSLGNGAGYPAMYVVAAVILMLFAVGFVAMTRHVPSAGAFYSYVEQGLGRGPGLGAAFLALITYTAVQGAVYGYLGFALNELLVTYGAPSLPWWLWSLVAIAVTGLLGYRHIDLSGKVLGVLLVAEIAIVLLLDASVVVRGGSDAEGLSTGVFHLDTITSGAPGIGLMMAIAGFIGFEATAVFRDEARDPDRTVPRATYAALALIGIFYSVSAWAVISGWGDTAAVAEATSDPGTMVATTTEQYLGPAAGHVVQVLLVSSLFACVLSFHNVLSRYLFALGNAAVLPSALGRSHTRHHSPHNGSFAQTATATALLVVCAGAGLDPVAEVFAWLSGAATAGILLLMLVTSVAVLVWFHRSRADTRLWHTRIAPGLGLVGLAACLAITVQNLPLLVGGSQTLALGIDAVLVLSLVAGPVLAAVRPGAGALPVVQDS
ncbi:APC family permease [Kineosporia sp. NBRC 101731]|uniref:APC family permease n=1 Tax=Kineosporia sp. NBRC 101731 TaxID=3032199 RepID=UPI0024A009D3|nr:APC family permease [Kineosporia sp. NBRC 101731]GLY31888.1 amino acid transporter [Kineosporia sp. NBRC 101731]